MISTELSNNGLPDNLPLLTQVVETDTQDDLPTLTEVVTDTADVVAKAKQPATLAAQENGGSTPTAEPNGESQPIANREAVAHETAAPPPRALSEEELQQILHHLEAHLDTMLASKLSLHFEKLRDALNAHLDSKIP